MLKGNKGISLTLAVITVLALIIILSTISFSAVNSIKMRRLNKLYNDIRVLNDAVAVYYIKNNELPIENSSAYEIELGSEVDEKLKFILKPSSANFTTSADLLNPNDFGSFKKTVTSGSSTTENTVEGVKYYKLNTGLLKNLSLNYDKVGTYIINPESFMIYYVEGIEIDDEIYHSLPITYRDVNLGSV